MNISYNWLKQYLNVAISAEEIANNLTSIGLEVEAIEKWESLKGGLAGVVIGEVKTCERHPNADKLSVTTVDIGRTEPLHIVCGAPNVRVGLKVPVATIGTVIYKGTDSFTIQKTKLRGELSEGMICGEDELGLGTKHDGIMELSLDTKNGTLASDYFNVTSDFIFVIGLTPNRIDSASHYGVARDLAAYLSRNQLVKANKPSIDHFKIDSVQKGITVVVENPKDCIRYSGITISGVQVQESPEWLKNRLKSIGLNPINNIVDVTNFILHELGQPLHAFDANKIKGNKVIIKNLPDSTSFVTLDGVERKLSSQDLMICDEAGGMCIAGVFGGLHSGVTAETSTVFIESAYFNPVSVRKTAKRHGLSTDSSFRFERGTDPNMPVYALKRAALLIKEIAGGTISSEITDFYPVPVADFEVKLSYKNIHRLIGKTLDKDLIKNILLSLEIKIIEENENGLTVLVPSYRVDVQREADVIEEILRIYGYNNVEISTTLYSTITLAPKPDPEKIKLIVSDILVANGFYEIMSNSLTKSSYFEKIDSEQGKDLVRLENPLSNDLNSLRKNLLFGGLESIIYNINRKNANLRFFEFGNCYRLDSSSATTNPLDKYIEDFHLSLFLTGNRSEGNWVTKKETVGFFQLKAYIEMILTRLGFNLFNIDQQECTNEYLREGISFQLAKNTLVTAGLVDVSVTKTMEINQDVLWADFNWKNILFALKNFKVSYTEIPKYPEVSRDLAILLDKNIKFNKIIELANRAEKNLLRKVSLFDVYENEEKLGKDKKSYAVNFVLQDFTKTLTDEQVDKIMNNFVKSFEKELAAQIR